MAYVPPTIHEKGLRQHLTGLGLDYDTYNDMMLQGQKRGAIAKALSYKSGKSVRPATVGSWKPIWEEERK